MTSKINDQAVNEYLAELASKTSTPGGGAVAALSGAQAAALIAMVGEFSEKTVGIEAREQILNLANETKNQFLELANQDALNFSSLMAAYKNKTGVQDALKAAATPPLECLALCIALKPSLDSLAKDGNANLVTDTGIAASLMVSTIASSEMNVLINLRSIKDTEFISQAQAKVERARSLIPELEQLAESIRTDLL